MNKLNARNLTAQLQYRGRGNPPAVHPDQSVANCYPGLEFDLRNIWKRIFVGIELHENRNIVLNATSPLTRKHALKNAILIAVRDQDGRSLVQLGPTGDPINAFDRPNAMASLINPGDQEVTCEFIPRPNELIVSSFLTGADSALIFDDRNGIDWTGLGLYDELTEAIAFNPWVSNISSENKQETALFDFGTERYITSISISPGIDEPVFNTSLVPYTLFPNDFFVEISSDKETWTRVVDVTPETYEFTPGNAQEFKLPSIPVRYARVTIRSKRKIVQGFITAFSEIEFASKTVPVSLKVRDIFHDQNGLLINERAMAPGELTQSLCSPWMYDYRDCWCVYWAASRPDIVNIDEEGNGHNWMDPERPDNDDGKAVYRGRNSEVDHNTAMTSWESKDVFKFQIGGKDEK